MNDGFGYHFPAIRGIQAQREYYIAMCRLRHLSKLFQNEDENLAPDLRAQRKLNKARIPELARYITNNADDYVFSALTVSIDADIEFIPIDGHRNAGTLQIPMSARFIINDGQHRRAAIERALQSSPELGSETIAVVFFLDKGLERCQQMFTDLNRHAIRPSTSLSILYDYRDVTARMVKTFIVDSDAFQNVIELEKTSLALRSRHLFTLSSIYYATRELLKGMRETTPDESARLAVEFWEAVAAEMHEWGQVRDGKQAAGYVRCAFVHTRSVVLQALARAGSTLICRYPKSWKTKITKIGEIDWRRANSSMWEGRAMVGGQFSKAHHHVVLTGNAIKTHLGLDLSEDEQRAESAYKRGGNGAKQATA